MGFQKTFNDSYMRYIKSEVIGEIASLQSYEMLAAENVAVDLISAGPCGCICQCGSGFHPDEE